MHTTYVRGNVADASHFLTRANDVEDSVVGTRSKNVELLIFYDGYGYIVLSSVGNA